jgi:heme-degrading monooxygenase HmoA
MEIVLIDQFTVPQSSLQEFLKQVHHSAGIVRTRPGFVEGFVHELTSGEGRTNVVTTAVWASESAMNDARKSIAEEFSKIGFNPPEIMTRLGVQIERGIFRRSPY